MFGHGTGSGVMKRIAAPMVGGLITSTILTLLIIPAVYYLWRGREVEIEPGKPVSCESLTRSASRGEYDAEH